MKIQSSARELFPSEMPNFVTVGVILSIVFPAKRHLVFALKGEFKGGEGFVYGALTKNKGKTRIGLSCQGVITF